MSFYGKNFKKTKFDNIDQLLDAHNAPESIRSLIKSTDSVTRFEKNADGSIQYIVSKNGEEKMNIKMIPNAETDFVTPNGIATKVGCKLNGDKIETIMAFPDGSKLHLERVFENNSAKQIIWKDDIDIKGTVHYEVV